MENKDIFSPIPPVKSAFNLNTNQKNGIIDFEKESPMRINYINRMMNLLSSPEYLKNKLSVGGAKIVIVDYSKAELSNLIPCGGYLSNKFAYGNGNCKVGFKL